VDLWLGVFDLLLLLEVALVGKLRVVILLDQILVVDLLLLLLLLTDLNLLLLSRWLHCHLASTT